MTSCITKPFWPLCATLALLATGCGMVYEYPESMPESSSEACSDGKDNDLDGKLDCDDPDCSTCPEEGEDACDDGFDNDGDGLVDLADPRCWSLSAPEVQRCAESSGVELVENFDAGPLWTGPGSQWAEAGFYLLGNEGYYITRASNHHSPSDRRDGLVNFNFNKAASSTLDTSQLGTLVRQWPFAGSWQGFNLSFSASVPPGAMLRAGIAPADLAPAQGAPLAGAETAFAVTIEGGRALQLDVEGVHFSVPLCASGELCDDSFSVVRVVLDSQGFLATLTRSDGTTARLRADAPSSLGIEPSRLVFWGGTTASESAALLDDLHLRVAGEAPCGFSVPQIPGPSCNFADSLAAFGQDVSIAGVDGEYCALVAASADATPRRPVVLTLWRSTDGRRWTPASSSDQPPLPLPLGATLVGAGIAHDGLAWHAAVTYKDGAGVVLAFADGTSCGGFGPLGASHTLFEDAEASSYVIRNGQHQVYFTRPPSGGGARTLWRISRGDSQSTGPEYLADLPDSVLHPAKVQLIGTRDLVLVHPTPRKLGLGIGLLVGDAQGRSWSSVGSAPLLRLPEPVENQSEAVLAFDDLGVSSAALAWDNTGGFLLYGGSSAFGLTDTTGTHPVLAVGTAHLAMSGGAKLVPATKQTNACGDGTCDASEACATCPADCPCEGVEIPIDAFTSSALWQIVSNDPQPAQVQYLDLSHNALNWAGASKKGTSTWSVLPLAQSIVGDFELSFDAFRSWLDPGKTSCAIYVGLGTVPSVTVAPSGVFARSSWSQCLGKYWTKPSVHAGGAVFEDPPEPGAARAECLSERFLTVGKRRTFVLRREGDRVSVGVTRDDGCGLFEQSITYSNALPELSALLVGFGEGSGPEVTTPSFAPCDPLGGAGTISNIRLRLLDKSAPAP